MPSVKKVENPNKRGHKYQVTGDDRIDPDQLLPPISSIARYSDGGDNDGLLYWAVDAYREMGLRNAFQLKNEEAMAIGTDLHGEIEEHIATGEQPANPSPLFGSWYSSLHEVGIEWYSSEVMVYSPRGFGGTVDAIGYLDGVPTIFDWKTTDEYRYLKDKEGNPDLDKDGNQKKQRKTINNPAHAAQIGGYLWAMQDMADYFPELPQPSQAYVIYVFKDTLNVLWKVVNVEKSMEAFQAANSLYAVTHRKGGLYGA